MRGTLIAVACERCITCQNQLLPCRWSWLTKGYGSTSRKNSRLKSETTGQLAQNSSARNTQIENEEEEEKKQHIFKL